MTLTLEESRRLHGLTLVESGKITPAQAAALNERFFPEAVVLDASLPLTAASGQPLPDAPALMAGERIRLAGEREGLVEIRLGGTSVGWGRLSGVWRVRDAARYTPSSSIDRGTRREGSDG